MPYSLILTTFILSFMSTTLSSAQDLDATIGGCEAVECPMVDFEPHCTLTNITFENIGLARIPDVPESLETFSIVKGVNISGDGADDFTSVYYLGTPDNMSLDDVHGCAVIFHDPPQEIFEQDGSHICSDVISQSCIDAIQDRASEIAEGDSDNLCEKLKQDLEDNEIDACENLTGGGQGIGAISSTSFSSIENIDSSSNSTSDCWPILPKSANLARIFTETVALDGGLNASTAYPELNRVTPLLTLFVKDEGTDSVVDETVSRLTCIAINTTQTVAEEDSENAASMSKFDALLGFALLSSLFMLL